MEDGQKEDSDLQGCRHPQISSAINLYMNVILIY